MALVFLTSCAGREGELVIVGSAELLEEPYPMNYPSTAPKPNRVIRVLQNERLKVTGTKMDKDFMVFEVESGRGENGFVISSPDVRFVPNGE